jgi:hypothetical protein
MQSPAAAVHVEEPRDDEGYASDAYGGDLDMGLDIDLADQYAREPADGIPGAGIDIHCPAEAKGKRPLATDGRLTYTTR